MKAVFSSVLNRRIKLFGFSKEIVIGIAKRIQLQFVISTLEEFCSVLVLITSFEKISSNEVLQN